MHTSYSCTLCVPNKSCVVYLNKPDETWDMWNEGAGVLDEMDGAVVLYDLSVATNIVHSIVA